MAHEAGKLSLRQIDRKRYLWLGGLLIPLLPLIGALLAFATDAGIFWFLTPFFVFFIVPLLDFVVGEDASNPNEAESTVLEADPYYRYCLFAFIPLQYVTLIWATWLAGGGSLHWIEYLGLTVSIGLLGGAAINVAHELGHKQPVIERWLAKIVLAQVAYGHFYVEHNRGHHRRVATPEDPASARFGENFYLFWLRTVTGSVLSAWNIERKRLAATGKSPFSFANHNIQAWSMTVMLFGLIVILFGLAALPMLLLQALIGISLLESVNYVEHYGLARRKDVNGQYECCRPEHSWNSNHTVTNIMLFHLQRHSHHHANPMRRYQVLRHFDDAPQLPTGYSGMILVSLIPSLWRKLMDPRVVAHYGGDVSRSNQG